MKKIKISGVYKITNIINNKFYIGSSIDIYRRLDAHQKTLNRNKHHSNHLQNAWNKYGESSFIFEVLEELPMLDNESKLEFKIRLVNGREQHYLDILMPWKGNIGYNINKDARSCLGIKRSVTHCKNISIAKKGKPGHPHTKEWITILSKPVIQYDMNDNIIAEYNSITEAAKITGLILQNIGAVVNGKYIQSGGFKWKYKNSDDIRKHRKKKFRKHSDATKAKMKGRHINNITSIKMKEAAKHRSGKLKSLIVLQIENGQIIKEWESIISASKELKITINKIRRICNGLKVKSPHKLIWKDEIKRKAAIAIKEKADKGRRSKWLKVNQYSLDNQLIKTWDCIAHVNTGGFSSAMVRFKCKEGGGIYEGYFWKFA